ncbi:MAG TPA: PspC domain-containing protein, partial [Lutibacter sp.]|nr:PspC domain-containing protein [Lutibacter sp.]
MSEQQDQTDHLLSKLETLLKKQAAFSKEVQELRDEITQLRIDAGKNPLEKNALFKEEPSEEQPKYTQSTAPKKLYRDLNHKILGGVCAGLATYFGISIILTRIIWLLLSIFFGVGFIAYVVMWIVIPKATVAAQKPQPQFVQNASKSAMPTADNLPKTTVDWEKFVGENLINKIGIAITVIGVGIGAKYS